MTTLVVYYSRTGNNRSIAEYIAKELGADIDEIIDKKKRGGILGWLQAGMDSASKNLTEIKYEKNPQDYDKIIIGCPIWAGNIIPPIRTYLETADLSGKKLAFFICSKTEGFKELFPKLKEMTPKAEHIGRLGITEKCFKNEDYQEDLNEFVDTI